MARDETCAGDGAAEEGEIRDEKRGDRGKLTRRRKEDSTSSEDSESSSPEDERGSSRRKRERASGRDSRRRKRERGDRRSSGSSKRKRGSRRRGGSGTDSEEEDSYSSSSSGSETESDSESGTGMESEEKSERLEESEGEARRRRRERRRKEEKERRRKKEKERERRRREKEKERKRRKEKEKERKRKKKEKKEKDLGKTGAVTNNWGKYGIIKETDMWNKRPEFTAWLAEVKQVNMESLANWEEKQMFKEFMEDHNTATFPSKKYYDLDAYHRQKISKQMRKGLKEAPKTERTVFDDEEQRRQELLKEREKMKEEQVEALKRSMQSGMAQAMKEQALLREEMQLQYKLGNFEAAAAIQRRLDPDVAM